MTMSMEAERGQATLAPPPDDAVMTMPAAQELDRSNSRSVPSARRQVARIVLAGLLGILIGQAGVISMDADNLGAATRAERIYLDMQGIARGLRNFSAAGQLKQQGLERMSWVYGPGELPLQVPFEEDGDAIPLDHIEGLAQGHYIQILIPDPWGNAYLANVDGLQAGTQRVKVLSAGPDGVIDTAPSAQEPRGDDVLIQLF